MPPKQNNDAKKEEEKAKLEEEKPKVNLELLKKTQYPPAGQSEVILQKLHAQRQDGEFCDIQLKLSETKTVYAHKSILATSSPYFEGMFSSGFAEMISGVVDLSPITNREDIIENVINTFYGRPFEINEGNVSETINIATMFLLDDLKEECAKILNVVVNIQNATELLQLSISFDLKDLQTKVIPVVKARFHDYIMFQENICDFSVEGFDMLQNIIDTGYVVWKARYVEFILKWFSTLETDERAGMLKKAISGIKFKITKRAYEDFKERLEDLINHLDDVNFDVSEKIRRQLKEVLPKLKPVDGVRNLQPGSKSAQNDSDSDLDEEPKRPLFSTFGADFDIYGPPTKKRGFTKEEEKIWKKAHEDMADRDQHRIWAKQWPLDITGKLGTRNDPNRPKVIKREIQPEILKSRKFRVKNDAELAEEANLIDGVILIAPSKDFSVRSTVDGVKDDSLDICVYIPRRRAWYKIESLSASSIQKKFNRNYAQQDSKESFRRSRPTGSNDNSDSDRDDDDEDAYRLAAMMDMYDHDFPPEIMMMMRDMPRSRRHRLMEEIAHGRIPPPMLRRMLERDMEEDDMRAHEYMMMREMSRMHRRHLMGPMAMFMDMGGRRREIDVRPLTDQKWKVVYLKHRLYFYHQDEREHVFCYDLETKNWFKSKISDSQHIRDKDKQGYAGSVDGLELIVMGQTLHAVLRIVMVEISPKGPWGKTKEQLIEESTRQEVYLKYTVYKMNGELDKATWEMVMESEGRDEQIPLDKHLRIDPEKDKYGGHPFYGEYGLEAVVRQPDALKTVLFAADEERLVIITFVRKFHYRDESIHGYNLSGVDVLYLDLKEMEHLWDSNYYQLSLGPLTALYGDYIAAMVDDELHPVAIIDLGRPGQNHRISNRGSTEPDKNKEFLEAQDLHPRRPNIMVGAPDGKNIWIFRGQNNDVSETVEVYATMCFELRKCEVKTENHPPPPFKYFTFGTTAKISKARVKTLIVPTRYLHAD